MCVYMFPGQGSQIPGMGASLFSQFPSEVKQANELLGYSIVELCINDSEKQLNRTQFTQPALYVVEALSYLAMRDNGVHPAYCIGHSLGEYSALFAAGAFDFITGLQLVNKRGELMASTSGGGMLAVLNLSVERIKFLLQANELNSIDFANFNSRTQVVLSGLHHDINKANEILSKEALMCVLLPVSAAFHSRYMDSVAIEFKQFITPFKFDPIHTPVIANATVEPYTMENIKENLVQQITSPVRWSETIGYLKNLGENEFTEIGPNNVLTRLMAQN